MSTRISDRIRELEVDLDMAVAAGTPIQAREIRTSLEILRIWEGS